MSKRAAALASVRAALAIRSAARCASVRAARAISLRRQRLLARKPRRVCDAICFVNWRVQKEGGSYLCSAGGGVGENKASAETEGKAGGFHRVSARRDVVHEIGLAERQRFAGAGKVVLVGGDRAKRVFVSGALGLNWLGSLDGLDNLSPGASSTGQVSGDVTGKAGVGVGVFRCCRDWNKPARAGNECGHFAGGGVESLPAG